MSDYVQLCGFCGRYYGTCSGHGCAGGTVPRREAQPEPNPTPLPANVYPPHVPAAPVRAASPHRQAQPTPYGAAPAQSLETAQQAIQDLAKTHSMSNADILALVGEWLAESDWRQGRRVGVVTREG